uniref:Uncharacterized protein n=1 Tax=Angiostrongylus cantonensis TaxID=6313 RepID=A0A0K0DQA2_ANGCA
MFLGSIRSYLRISSFKDKKRPELCNIWVFSKQELPLLQGSQQHGDECYGDYSDDCSPGETAGFSAETTAIRSFKIEKKLLQPVLVTVPSISVDLCAMTGLCVITMLGPYYPFRLLCTGVCSSVIHVPLNKDMQAFWPIALVRERL